MDRLFNFFWYFPARCRNPAGNTARVPAGSPVAQRCAEYPTRVQKGPLRVRSPSAVVVSDNFCRIGSDEPMRTRFATRQRKRAARLQAPGEMVQIEVRDSGIGIAPINTAIFLRSDRRRAATA
jgi:hypothetical protein